MPRKSRKQAVIHRTDGQELVRWFRSRERSAKEIAEKLAAGARESPGEKLAWTEPSTVGVWAKVFKVHRNTMSKFLKEQRVRNKRLARSRYQIALDDLPGTEKAKRVGINKAR